jgi:hypothetical protein
MDTDCGEWPVACTPAALSKPNKGRCLKPTSLELRNLLLSGAAIGVGIALSFAGMAAIGSVAYKYVNVQHANDPIKISADNEAEYEKLTIAISKLRRDDIVQYCLGRDNPGICSALHGWDNFDAPDSGYMYNHIMRLKIEQGWSGDNMWLYRKLNEDYK